MFFKDSYLIERFIDRRLKNRFIKNISNSTRDNNKIIMVITNITCNLNCFCCATFSDLKIGSNSYNKEPFILEPKILNEFLVNISEYKPNYYISLQGGETTVLNNNTINEYIKVIRNNNRKVLCLTNGYNITKLDPYLFDKIILDEHMSNGDDIVNAVKYFEKNNYYDFAINVTRYHYDLRRIMKDNRIVNNFKCGDMFDAITLHNKVVYPCCVSPMLQGYENRTDYIEDLISSGFIYNNKDLSILLNNIEDSLPDSFYDVCFNYCYRRRKEAKKIYRPTDYKIKTV